MEINEFFDDVNDLIKDEEISEKNSIIPEEEHD